LHGERVPPPCSATSRRISPPRRAAPGSHRARSRTSAAELSVLRAPTLLRALTLHYADRHTTRHAELRGTANAPDASCRAALRLPGPRAAAAAPGRRLERRRGRREARRPLQHPPALAGQVPPERRHLDSQGAAGRRAPVTRPLSDLVLRGRVGAYRRWASTEDRRAATA